MPFGTECKSGADPDLSDISSKRVFLTGGTGFIGREVLHQLRKQGYEVVAQSRSAAGRRYLEQQGVVVLRSQLSDQGALKGVLERCDAVINLAYDVRADGPSNLAAFNALLKAAQDVHVRTFIHMSSIVVYDDWPNGALDAYSPVTPGGSVYRRTKIEMERIAHEQDLAVALLEPTLVYGAQSSLWTKRFLDALSGTGVVLPEGAGHAALVHVSDVAAAVMCALRADIQSTAKFPLNAAEPVRWADYLNGLSEIAGGRGVIRTADQDLFARLGPRSEGAMKPSGPSRAAQISAMARRALGHDAFERIVGAVRRVRPGSDEPFYPDHTMLDLYLANPKISTEAAQAGLGWSPEMDLTAGLREIRENFPKKP